MAYHVLNLKITMKLALLKVEGPLYHQSVMQSLSFVLESLLEIDSIVVISYQFQICLALASTVFGIYERGMTFLMPTRTQLSILQLLAQQLATCTDIYNREYENHCISCNY